METANPKRRKRPRRERAGETQINFRAPESLIDRYRALVKKANKRRKYAGPDVPLPSKLHLQDLYVLALKRYMEECEKLNQKPAATE